MNPENFLKEFKPRLLRFVKDVDFETLIVKSKTSLKILVVLGFFLFLYSGGNFSPKPQTVAVVPERPKILTPVSANLPPPQLTATAAAVFDINSGNFLFEKNANLPMPLASTTKMMTAIVVLQNCRPEQIASVSSVPKNNFESRMGLVVGEQMSVENLLYGLMLPSGNDAAAALAQTCIARGIPTNLATEQFITSMNKTAQEMDMKDTHFTNVAGLDEKGHYSTARDLTKLASRLLEIPVLAKIVGTPKTIVADISGLYLHQLENKNKLLGKIPGVLGIKTGTTEAAREALVSAIERDNHKIILVLLGSEDRFGETEKLIDWTFENYKWELR